MMLTFEILGRARNQGKSSRLKLCQTSFSGIVHLFYINLIAFCVALSKPRLQISSNETSSSSRFSDFQNSFSFELRDSVFGSLPFSEFRGFVRYKIFI